MSVNSEKETKIKSNILETLTFAECVQYESFKTFLSK